MKQRREGGREGGRGTYQDNHEKTSKDIVAA